MDARITIYGMLVCYKIAILVAGVLMSYMGFRLFLADKVAPSGDFGAHSGKYGLTLKKAAPGTFFCLMGTILICVSILRQYSDFEFSTESENQAGGTQVVIPAHPPASLRAKGDAK